MVALGTCRPCNAGINPVVSCGSCEEQVNVEEGVVRNFGGGMKEREMCGPGNFVATKLVRCGPGSSVSVVLGDMAQERGETTIACGDCGFWPASGFCDACRLGSNVSVFLGFMTKECRDSIFRCSVRDCCDFWGTSIAVDN